MSNRILLCIDQSSFSEAATAVAVQIARAVEDARLTILHVVNVKEPTGNIVKDLPGRLGFEPAVVRPEVVRQHEAAGQQLLEAAQRAATLGEIRDVETRCDTGSVAERIAHHARLCDLVVMGLRGDTEDQFPGQGGSVLGSVMSSVSAPILFVTREARRLESIAVGYDGSTSAARAVHALEPLVEGLGLQVHAIFVSHDGAGGEVLSEVAEILPGADIVEHVVAGEEAHVEIAREAGEAGADCLALGFRGHSPLKDFLYGSATEYILMHTKMMVLVAR